MLERIQYQLWLLVGEIVAQSLEYSVYHCSVYNSIAVTSLIDPPPLNCSNWPSLFWQPCFSRHPAQQPFLVVNVREVHLCRPLYVAVSSLTLPLRQRIKPFTSSKALSGPYQGLFIPCPPVGGFGGGVVCAGSEYHKPVGAGPWHIFPVISVIIQQLRRSRMINDEC